MESEAFHADLERLAEGEPLGYLIGHIPFLNTTIHLDSRPLIPRTETELWTERAIADIEKAAKAALVFKEASADYKNGNTLGVPPSPLNILDLCAGSGAVGVAVLKAVPHTTVDFAEIDTKHHATIQKNIIENDIDETRTRVFAGDLFENISDTYDFILSNPPYIDPSIDRTEKSVKDFEPHIALYGGQDGLEIIDRIITALPAHLSQNGIAYIEHEPEQTDDIQAIAVKHGLRAVTHPDQYDTQRYTTLSR